MRRIAGVFIIIGMLFNYLPIDGMGSCPEDDHSTNMGMDCGYAFHCPVLSDPALPQLPTLSMNGWSRWIPTIETIEEFPQFIFHPPET